ncbi:hypothetical protein SBA2_810024 [Acidobacteriia bacterium SbA2]|nr:hypothetical protein SBA2_810024 [Acidobacteriia bacterium SbA2]
MPTTSVGTYAPPADHVWTFKRVAQSLCLSNSAALALNNSSIINARARIPHTKDRRVPTPGTLRYPLRPAPARA